MRKILTGGASPVVSPLCLLLGVSAGAAQAQEPSAAHSSTMQTITVNHPTGGWSQVVSFDYNTNTQVHTTDVKVGFETEHDILIRQYTSTEYAFENWGGAWIYDVTNGMYSGAMFFVQQPLPGLPVRPPGPSIPSFGTVTAYGTGTAPAAVAVADLNGDGRPDLITANRDGVSGTTFLNSAGSPGTFTTGNSYSVSGSPQTLCAADFNNSGNADVIWGGFNSSQLHVRLNNGSGSLGSEALYTTEFRPKDLRTGDVDKNGTLDVVAAGQGNVAVHTNNGAGVFSQVFSAALGDSNGVELADVDNDNDLDIILINNDPHLLRVIFNQGGTQGGTLGTFSTTDMKTVATTGFVAGFPSHIVAGDFNKDGKVDVALAHGAGNVVTYWQGDGAGNFANPIVHTVASTIQGTVKIAKGDFNADGNLDLVVAGGTGSNDIAVLTGFGNGGFTDPLLLTSGGSNISGVVAAHFNGDGKDDIAVASKGNNTMRVLRVQ